MASSMIGRTLGKYKITGELGRGGMAAVYQGYQQDLDRFVAIKILPPHPGLDEQFIERFDREAKTIARLQHPHILPVYENGAQDDILYLVMAYIEGGTLADVIDNGPMEPAAVEKILREVASALDYAHRRGVIHRDIKPGNILLDSEGHALLADFGIVKLSEGGSNLTGTGVVGTPAYMAPEQAQGLDIDQRVDIYALGVVIYELLTGRQPYSGDTPMQVLLKHVQDPVPSIVATKTGLPLGLDQVMKRVLAKNPEERYQTAVEFAQAFTQALHVGDASVAPTESVTAAVESAARSTTAQQTQLPQDTLTPDGAAHPQTQPTTIVVQGAASNPLVLLGGFALIAIVIVVVVVLVISNQNQAAPIANNPTESAAANPTATEQAAVAVPTAIPVATFGRLQFTTSTNPGDTVQLQVDSLSPVGEGKVYAAWLVNTTTEDILSLGKLTLDAFGTGSLTYADPDGKVLAAWFDSVIITPETEIGDAPTGEVTYNGSVPADLTAALRQILVAANSDESPVTFENLVPSKDSLQQGALAEAATARQHSGLAADATNAGGMHTHAEHTINVLLGTEDDYNGNGRGENPGRKIGVPFYLDTIDNLLDTALADASLNIQTEGELIKVCVTNARDWVDGIVGLEKELLASEDIEAVQAQKVEATTLADALIAGIDQNENGLVEPFEGECGLDQIETFGVLAVSMDIIEGAPVEG